MSEHHEPTTLRSLQDGVIARHGMFIHPESEGIEECMHCGHVWPCADYSDAVAALAILDAAPREHMTFTDGRRLVPDSGVTPPQQHTKRA